MQKIKKAEVTTTLSLDFDLRHRIDQYRFSRAAAERKLPVGMKDVMVAALSEFLDRQETSLT